MKKDEEYNVYEAEVINVKYSPNSYGYLFSITIEAMEEDVAGVYEATVLCNSDDGKRTLIKFIRSPRAPAGMYKLVLLIIIHLLLLLFPSIFRCTHHKYRHLIIFFVHYPLYVESCSWYMLVLDVAISTHLVIYFSRFS